jgi:hypothetical protein
MEPDAADSTEDLLDFPDDEGSKFLRHVETSIHSLWDVMV